MKTRVLASIVLLVTVLFALIRNLYRAMYLEPRSEAISRDLNLFYRDNDDDDSSNDGGDGKRDDRVARRDRILRLRERMSVGLDSLPTIRFDSLASHSSSSSSSSSRKKRRKKSITRDDDEEEQEDRAIRELQRECLTHGAFVSTADEYVDCRAYCNVSDGVKYRYYDRLGVLLNGRAGRVGAYCMPTDAAVCNTNTSLVVYGRGGDDDDDDDGGGGGSDSGSSGWRCIPQMRAFAGEGGNMIVACDGRLLDRATGRIWYEHIDPTLAFDSIDEFLPAGKNDPTTMYRFVCPPSRDERDNRRIEAPFDRLVLLNNTCASLIPRADDAIRPDFARGLCECGSRARYDSALGTCVPLDPVVSSRSIDDDDDLFYDYNIWTSISGVDSWMSSSGGDDGVDSSSDNELFSPKTLETVIVDRSGPCWEPWMTLSQARELSNVASKMTTMPMTLCGVEHSSAGSGAANLAFARTRALVFDRVVPSPTAMLISATSLRTID